MIKIRPYQLADAPDLFAAARESIDTVGRWLPWCHADYKIEHSEQWIEAQITAGSAGSAYEFAIFSHENRFLGGCGLNAIDSINSRANLGYWVRQSAACTGVATAATALLIDWAFQNTALNRLEILVATTNDASLRVATKVGARREGTLRERIRIHGQYHDAVMFSVTKGDRIAPAGDLRKH